MRDPCAKRFIVAAKISSSFLSQIFVIHFDNNVIKADLLTVATWSNRSILTNYCFKFNNYGF